MMRLRSATEQDIASMLSIQSQMMLSPTATDMRRGGLLVEVTYETLLSCISYGDVLLLEDLHHHTVAGYTIGFSNEAVHRSSFLRTFILDEFKWNNPAERKQILESKFGLLLIVVVLSNPTYKLYASALALAMTKLLFERHQHILAIIAYKPMENLASRTLLEFFSAWKVAETEKKNQILDSVTWALYCMNYSEFETRIQNSEKRSPLATRVLQMVEQLMAK